MKYMSLYCLIGISTFLLCIVGLNVNADTITLEKEAEIQVAAEVNRAIESLTEKVMNCIRENNGRTEGCICLNECSCKFKSEYVSAKDAYQKAIKTYPHWEENVVFFQKEGRGMGYTINFQALKPQFSAECTQ